jgi:4-amino-4-deoxy-L-arabinose transferase-like glycosyltransferase
MSRRLIGVILLCAALYLVGNARVSLWDRDEPRYAQASRQMLESGDWVVPKLLDDPRINKPPMIYWLQASAMGVMRRIAPDERLSIEGRMERDAAAARLPSAVGMVLTLVLIGLVLVRLVGEERAFWTVVVFGTSGLAMMAAKMCLTDAVLLLFVTGSQFCLYAMLRGRATWWVVIAFAVCSGLGFLTKGPVVLAVNATTLLVLGVMRVALASSKSLPVENHGQTSLPMPPGAVLECEHPSTHSTIDWSSWIFKPLVALAIVVAIVAPWVVLMQQRIPGGLEDTLRHDVLKRMTTPLEQHKGPPGYYLVFFLASFFPWCLLLPTAIKIAWRNRQEPVIRFSLAAVVGPWVMFECIATKLPHYVLPCFPFLAVVTADAIVRGIRGEQRDWLGRGWLVAVGVWAVALIGVGAAPWAAGLKRFGFEQLPYEAMAAVSAAACVVAAMVLVQFARRSIAAAVGWMAGGTFLVMGLLFVTYLPRAKFLHLSEEVGASLQSAGATEKGEVYMIDYKEDSLPFYQGGTIRPQSKNTYLATEPPENWPKFLVITREIWEKTPPSARERLEVLKTFKGWAYAAKGRVVEVMIVKKK